jgi:hypothetical protein
VKKYTYTIGLKKIYTYVKPLTKDDLQELTNKCKSINNMCSGDGAGLLGGCLVDILLSKYFKEKFTDNYFMSGKATCEYATLICR